MKTTIRYNGPRNERWKKAYEDAIEYNTRAVKIIEAEIKAVWAKSRKEAVRMCHFACSFAGIEGLPARAILRNAVTGSPTKKT